MIIFISLYHNQPLNTLQAMRTIQGLSERHVAQIIRRKMIQKAKPSGKVYDRNKIKKSV
jgi:hypothetical protein